MRRRPIQVFKVEAKPTPGEKPVLLKELQLIAEGNTIDAQREDARGKLVESGFKVRSLSNTVEGHLLAYVIKAAPLTPHQKRKVPESQLVARARQRG